jgi:histidyl-tRNA synthetase
MIEPRVLGGFRDYLPEAMIPRERLIATAQRVYRSFGFLPIDTPALEYLEILTGKGSDETDKQMYRFETGGKQVALRFDLTVPLARFVAQHAPDLGLPFKRYHIATVWRGERQQRGRYREFMQCDFDTIGVTNLSADIETALVINELLTAIGFDKFTIRINNRKVLNGLLAKVNLSEQSVAVLRAIDKLPKSTRDKVIEEMMTTTSCAREQCESVLAMAELEGTNDEVLAQLRPLVAGNELGEKGVAELQELLAGALAAGVPEKRLKLDVSIARGLDYYTGPIFETFLDDLPTIGSVCSGGRYDNLAGLYTKQILPGVGASLGLDRLLAAMEELKLIEPIKTTAPILVAYFDAARRNDYLKIAADLRRAGLGVELYPEPKKINQQLQYAEKKGFRVAIIAGDRELAANNCQVKNLATRESVEASLDNRCEAVIAAVRQILV